METTTIIKIVTSVLMIVIILALRKIDKKIKSHNITYEERKRLNNKIVVLVLVGLFDGIMFFQTDLEFVFSVGIFLFIIPSFILFQKFKE